MGFSFGKRSMDNLNTCHTDLIKIHLVAISRSKVDYGISEGHRSVKRQQKLYAQGRTTPGSKVTNVDGVENIGKHNLIPSEATDMFAYHPDKATRAKIDFDKVHLTYIAGLMDAVAEELLLKCEITHSIRWGANWDNDGVIAFDQNFDDYPHTELYIK
jgi:peptidoglycan L-alanyl-D-glutamate endopeptidase CwlK